MMCAIVSWNADPSSWTSLYIKFILNIWDYSDIAFSLCNLILLPLECISYYKAHKIEICHEILSKWSQSQNRDTCQENRVYSACFPKIFYS